MNKEFDDDKKWVLTPWGCLCCVLSDYNIDVSRIPGRVGEHIVEDFMELMCKQGYCRSVENKETANE